jgi:hypothetical protein
MFDRDSGAVPSGRYRVEIVSDQWREKSHLPKVQAALDEGSAAGWRLVSATTTNASGVYVTGIFWDTTPER